MSSSSVWVQLYYKGENEPEGQPVKIKPAPEDVADLIEAAKAKLKPKIDYAPVNEIYVYSPDTERPFSEQTSIRGDKTLKELIDELVNKNPQVSIGYDHPLIVVAPAPAPYPPWFHQTPEFSAQQINALAAFAQEEMDNRTKHKPMSEASVTFAHSLLAGNGVQTAVEAPIHESGSLADPPKFSWEVVDSDGQVRNKSEHDGTSEVVSWANKHLLAGEKEYGLKVVTGAKLPMVKGNRKSATGKGDIAIGKLVHMKHGETFTFVNGLVELKADRSSLKTGQNLLELFALSMISKFGRGVALLATNCDETWETFHFSRVGVITRRFYDHGGKAWEEFMKLIKSAEQRHLQSIPTASLAAIKEDDKDDKDEQNLGGFDIPAHERKKQRALDDQAMLECIADHLGALYGERPVVPLWAHAEARISDYYG